MNIFKYIYLGSCLTLACLTSCKEEAQEEMMRTFEPINFSEVKINDDFWNPRLKAHASTILNVCIDQIENQTGRIKNFENAAKKEGKHLGIFFDDSDVYKAMEGMAYSLVNNPNPAIESKLDEWIDKIAAAQEPDGYINTYYTLTGLENRWTNMDMHEMYCAGHMLEAAIAYYNVTGKTKFLDVSKKMVEHMMSVFGPNKRHWVPGHEEIELALIKLYSLTRDKRYLDFSYWLLEERGHEHGTKGPNGGEWMPSFFQDDMPVKDLSTVSGHAVRCMYLYSGMADVAAMKRDTAYVNALNRIWDNLINRKMYLTGGIGSSKYNEGFTEDYDLPNKEAYCETCASVGMVFWNHRMNLMSGNAKYVNILERSLYNGTLSGVSLSGDKFFYVNPLESEGNHHRKPWYGVACCPSQISRFLPSIGSYIYGKSEDAIWVNLFISSETKADIKGNTVGIEQKTQYPWNGKVTIKLTPTKNEAFKLKIRKPDWTDSYTLTLNKQKQDATVDNNGYISLDRKWTADDTVEVIWDMEIKVQESNAHVKANMNKRAIQRGPIVYCLERIDNSDYENALLTENTTFYGTFVTNQLNGIYSIKSDSGLNFIPYYSWDNREAGEMKVWVDYQ